MLLSKKVAIVTGGAGGIGKGIAEVFAQEGAVVIVADCHVAAGESLVTALRDQGSDAQFVRCDVAESSDVTSMVDQVITRHGRIDVLVNNAGLNFVKDFAHVTLQEWDRVLGVDLRGAFLCTRACIDTFLRQRAGAVVNIASVHTQACLPGAGPYDAAKWGLVGLTKSLAVEYAPHGIRFNCVSPGLIDTQIWADLQSAAADLEQCHAHWRANIPMGRVGSTREVAHAAAFLVSDRASYITGANLVVDGGMTSQLISKGP